MEIIIHGAHEFQVVGTIHRPAHVALVDGLFQPGDPEAFGVAIEEGVTCSWSYGSIVSLAAIFRATVSKTSTSRPLG
jgi:hypothetical protein